MSSVLGVLCCALDVEGNKFDCDDDGTGDMINWVDVSSIEISECSSGDSYQAIITGLLFNCCSITNAAFSVFPVELHCSFSFT